MNIRKYTTVTERRAALEKRLDIQLEAIKGQNFVDTSHNCENVIGLTSVPLGIAGPLQLRSGQFGKRDYFLPLATTEGALIASVSRGCKAITQSGGAHVVTERVGITRAPVFFVNNISKGKDFITWIEQHMDEIKNIVESTSSHLQMLSVQPSMLGQYVYLRFSFDTQDAMGMNMATIAVDSVVPFIEKGTKTRCISLSGNVCVDKKSNYINFTQGRGIKVWADVILPETIVTDVLKTTIKDIVATQTAKVLYGSIVSGSIGANAHMANVLAALFLATGQDIAHIAECATGITQLEERDGSLYASIYLPDVIIGTIGGGTGLPTQKEALTILGVAGGNDGQNALQLAEVIGGAVLAGEISLLAALSSRDLAKAHQSLGRKKKI